MEDRANLRVELTFKVEVIDPEKETLRGKREERGALEERKRSLLEEGRKTTRRVR